MSAEEDHQVLAAWPGPEAFRNGPSMAEIAAGVAAWYGVTLQQIQVGKRCLRYGPFVRARQHAMYELHRSGRSLAQVAQFFGYEDGSNVAYHIRRHRKRVGAP